MATFTGTMNSDTITPDDVSPGVTAVPAGSKPSASTADVINGDGGDDSLAGGGGGDTIFAGSGNDSAGGRSEYSSDQPNSGSTIHGGSGDDGLSLFLAHAGNAYGSYNAIYGDDGDDFINLAFDTMSQPGGMDPNSPVYLYGGNGNDSVDVQAPWGSLGGDLISLSGMTAYLYGGAGSDTLDATSFDSHPGRSGGANHDYLYGGAGDDTYVIFEEMDHVIEAANSGNDTVAYGSGIYTLPRNVENLEVFYTGIGLEEPGRVTGNDLGNLIRVERLGNDFTINGLGGDDTIYGGNPRVDAEYVGRDTIWAGTGNDAVDGREGYDNIHGESGNDTLHGGAGYDRVDGGTGSDTLYGDDDYDILRGGEGLDSLHGGNGGDRFDYDAAAESKPGAAQRDVIVDFAGGDRIDLSTIDANTALAGNQTFSFSGTDAFTGSAQVRVAASGTDTLIQANTGGTSAPELEIVVNDAAVLPGQWVAGDFVL